jgi:hypothetical protein
MQWRCTGDPHKFEHCIEILGREWARLLSEMTQSVFEDKDRSDAFTQAGGTVFEKRSMDR